MGGERVLMHPFDPTVLVYLPAIQSLLCPEPELAPTDAPVIKLGGRGLLLTLTLLVDDLEVGPPVDEHREDLTDEVLPGVRHVFTALFEKLGGGEILGRL